MKQTAWFALAAVLCGVPVAPAGDNTPKAAEQWPHWRGPLATGVAPHGDPPTTWDEKTNIKWKVALPGTRGSSTPIVWGDSVFIAAALDTKRVAVADGSAGLAEAVARVEVADVGPPRLLAREVVAVDAVRAERDPDALAVGGR